MNATSYVHAISYFLCPWTYKYIIHLMISTSISDTPL